MIDVRDRREKILYFEGEPRYEVKYVAAPSTRTPTSASSCCSAPPTAEMLARRRRSPGRARRRVSEAREELFQYRGLILGSIEAGSFTGDQLKMIAEFVDRRGVACWFSAAGGHSRGSYAGTAVAK